MARIRTIKPEFWTDGKTGKLSDRAKLLMIGLLNHCDDYGVIELNEAEWKAKIFPYDTRGESEAIRAPLMDELLPKGLIVLFYYGQDAATSKAYIHITNFDRHQRIDRPSPPMLKGWKRGDNPETFGEREADDSATLSQPCKIGEDSASTRRGLGEDSAQEGKEGRKGKERKGVGLTQELRAKDAPKSTEGEAQEPTPPPDPDALSPLTRDSSSASQGKSRNGTGTGAGMKKLGMDVRELLAADIPKVEASPDDELETQRRRAEQLRKLREGAA